MIQKILSKVISRPNLCAFLCLGVVNLMAYGIMAPLLGFYGDDWGYIWLLFKGPGLNAFLGNSRVGFIPFYNVLAAVLGPAPLGWLVFMLLVRWVNAFCFWLVLHRIWPEARRATLTAALLYAVYPGFYLNSAAVNISMFLVLLTFFYLSLYLHLGSLIGRYRVLLLSAALLFGAAGIALAEYFFFMELVRPVIVALFLAERRKNTGGLLKSTLIATLPFLVMFAIAVTWRLLFQSTINAHYSLKLIDDLRASPFPTILQQLNRMGSDLLQSGLATWLRPFYPVDLFNRPNTPRTLYYILFLLLAGVFSGLAFINSRNMTTVTPRRKTALLFVLLGFLWFILSGWSIWLARLEITHIFSTTRFTMPFMPGAALLITGLILLVPEPRFIQTGLTSLLLAGAIALQLLVANDFRMDWVKQEAFYRQLTWRLPGLKPGTTILISRNPLDNGEENSISAAVNYIYSPGNTTGVDYYAYFNPDKYAADMAAYDPAISAAQPHLIGSFTPDPGLKVALFLDDRNCMRVLYPGLDEKNSRLNDFIREGARLSHPDAVISESNPGISTDMKKVFGSEPAYDWCRLYQEADLLSRGGQWQQIAALAELHLEPAEYSADWQKLLVFIEAYARTGQWEKARQVFSNIPAVRPGEQAVFCQAAAGWEERMVLDIAFEKDLRDRQQAYRCSKNNR